VEGDLVVTGRARSGPCHGPPSDDTTLSLQRCCAEAFHEAGLSPNRIDAACLALAGVGDPLVRDLWRLWAQNHLTAKVTVVHDAEPVLKATGHGIGIALLAGTGSLAFGRNQLGQEARAGGLGPVIGDPGSGFALGRRALRAVLAEHHEDDSPTQLTQLLLNHLGCKRPRELLQRFAWEKTQPSEIASLAELVLLAAENGDAVAKDLLQHTALELSYLVRRVVRKLGRRGDVLPLVFSGALLTATEVLSARVRAELSADPLPLTEFHVVAEPVKGCLRLAEELLED
jgi:N-acetylglucosamine kinase-like BadF-type ATPase